MVGSKEDFRNSAESNSADSSAWDSLSDTKFGNESANESSAESENTVEERNNKIGGKLFGIYKKLLNKLSKSELSNGDVLDAGYGTVDDNVGGDRDTSVNSEFVFNAALDAGYDTVENGASLDVEVNDALDAGYDTMGDNVGGNRDTSVNSEYTSRIVEDGASLDAENGAMETVRITGDSSNDNFFVDPGEPTDLGSYAKQEEYGYPDNNRHGTIHVGSNSGIDMPFNFRYMGNLSPRMHEPDTPDNPDERPDYPDTPPDSPDDPLNFSDFEGASVDSNYRQAQEGTSLDNEWRASSAAEDGAALDIEDDTADGGAWDAEDNSSNDGSFESGSMDSAKKVAVETDTDRSEIKDLLAEAEEIREYIKLDARAAYDQWIERADNMKQYDPAFADYLRRSAEQYKKETENMLGEKI